MPACSSSDDDEDDPSNSAPSVSAGEDQTVNQGATVYLTGVASDSDGSISSWLWRQTSGSPSVTIKNSTTSNASFSAPEVDAETTLVFELEVKDNDGASVSDSMRVTVRGPGDSVNPLPSDFEADAGDSQVTLSWTHHSDASTDYNIYRSSDSDCELANYTSCEGNALFTSKSSGFIDDGLTNGTTYYYWIEAILDGVTYLDDEAISASPAAENSGSDGSTWVQATGDAAWSGRNEHTSVVFDNKLWVLGGYSSGYKNDVWYSEDGVTWTQATSDAGWSGRDNYTSVVFDDKLWVIGGDPKDDVWYSEDGENWTLATSSAGWSTRNRHSSVIFDNKGRSEQIIFSSPI